MTATTAGDTRPDTGPDTASLPVRSAPNAIRNPLSRNTRVRLPAGTVVRSTNPSRRRRVLVRAQTVFVHSVSDGWVDLWNDAKRGRGYVMLPELVFVGGGGYWSDVKVTPELCAALGVDVPDLPEIDQRGGYALDALPGYGPGYDNRDA